MNTITFSHRYVKMPPGVEFLDTYIKDVRAVEYKDLTAEEIEKDTAIVGGGHYPLPQTRLIVISLWSNALPAPVSWATMRRHTPEKFMYYFGLRGQQVKIEIKEG